MTTVSNEAGGVEWWRAVAAPWVHILRPRRAVAVLLAARHRDVGLAMLGIGVAVMVTVFIPLIVMQHADLHWSAGGDFGWIGTWEAAESDWRPAAMDWRDWLRLAGLGLLQTSAALGIVMFIGVVSAMVSVLHADGLNASTFRAIRVMVAGGGLLTILLAGWVWFAGKSEEWTPEMGLLLAVAVCMLCMWSSSAAEGARRTLARVDDVKHCEECGYDLRQRPSKGRCPECGEWVAFSLDARVARPGALPFAPPRGIRTWLETTWRVLSSPYEFYRDVPARTGLALARRFAFWHLAAMGLFAGVLWLTVQWAWRPQENGTIATSCIVAFGLPALIWWLHRAIGQLVMTWWHVSGRIADIGCGRTVVAYETAWWWPAVLGNVLLLTAWHAQPDYFLGWTQHHLSPIGGLGNWTQVVVFVRHRDAALTVNTLLLVICLWRYHVAASRIRWSNF